MEFIPQPEDTKKFGMRWLKWHIYKYPTIALTCLPIPFIIYKVSAILLKTNRELRTGKYVPNVVMNRYAICRPTDYGAITTPSRYRN